ncbi:SEL1-like repeat protein, partial [Rhodoplanes serenus]
RRRIAGHTPAAALVAGLLLATMAPLAAQQPATPAPSPAPSRPAASPPKPTAPAAKPPAGAPAKPAAGAAAPARPGGAEPDVAFGAFQRGYFLTAFHEATKRVETGDVRAMTLLGELYAAGLGVPQNDQKAAEWYAFAAG